MTGFNGRAPKDFNRRAPKPWPWITFELISRRPDGGDVRQAVSVYTGGRRLTVNEVAVDLLEAMLSYNHDALFVSLEQLPEQAGEE